MVLSESAELGGGWAENNPGLRIGFHAAAGGLRSE